ncbi:MAG: BPL-N domain-containing protein [Trueperaceae bacterium]
MIVVYQGAGTGDPTREGIEAFLTHAGLAWRGVGPEDLTEEGLADVDAVYWPGGWAWPYVRDVAPSGKRALRGLVERGGAYVGVCAGAYHAADLIKWEGRFHEYDVDLFHGLAEGPIDVIEPWKGWRLTELELHDHPVHDGATRQTALYWGGPAFRLHPKQPTTVLASYAVTGDPAAITFAFGRGQVLLMGCHLELGWDADAGRMDLVGGHGAQWSWLERALAWTLEQGRQR